MSAGQDGYIRIAFSEDACDSFRMMFEMLTGYTVELSFKNDSKGVLDVVVGCIFFEDNETLRGAQLEMLECWEFDDTKPDSKGSLRRFDLDDIEAIYVY